MSSGGSGSSIFGAYAVVKSIEGRLGPNGDVRADQATLDEHELQELEGELYGEGAGPRRPEDDGVEPVAAVHVPHPHVHLLRHG